MNANIDMDQLNEVREQRRRRTYATCFLIFAMFSIMNMLGNKMTYSQRISSSDPFSKFNYLDFVRMLELVQKEYQLGYISGLNENINGNNNITNTNNEQGVNQQENDNDSYQQQYPTLDIIDDVNQLKTKSVNSENQAKNTDKNNQDSKEDGEDKQPLQPSQYNNVFLDTNAQHMRDSEIDIYKNLLKYIKDARITENQITRNLLKRISSKELSGSWELKDEKSINFFGFEHTKGQGDTKILSLAALHEEKSNIYFSFFDGQYVDKKRLYTFFDYSAGDQVNHEIATPTISFKKVLVLESYDKMDNISEQFCDSNIEFKFSELSMTDEDNKYISIPQIFVKIYSKQCSFEINLKVQQINNGDYWKQAITYSLIVTVLAFTHLAGLLKTLKNIISNPQDAPKYSIGSIAFIYIWDGCFSFIHIFYAISDFGAFQYLMPPAIIFLILWIVFERTLMLQIWKIQNYDQIELVDQNHREAVFRKQLTMFHAKLLLGFLAFVMIAKIFLYEQFFMILINCYFVFQIITTAIRGQQTKIDKYFLWFLLLPRSFIPLYLKGCPSNIYKLSPSLGGFFGILFVLVVQISLIYAQQYFGPRFFVPSMFLPYKFNYFIKLPENLDIESGLDSEFTDDCTICFTALHLEPGVDLNDENSQDNPFYRRLRKKKKCIMKTPCNHNYHIQCLTNWMNIKMECPTCRQTLPPL